jgi:hypothetical protein
MPIIPTPQKGQPLDVAYISSIVNEVNNLVSSTMPTESNMTTIKGAGNAAPQKTPTLKSQVYGVTAMVVASGSSVNAGEDRPFEINYQFKYPPIIVATPWNVGATDAGKNVSIYIKSVTETKANLVAKFSTGGNAAVDVNVLAIGIPN